MGGTLTTFIALGRGSVFDRDGYTDTLLGPERTRECLSRQSKRSEGLSSIPPTGLGRVGLGNQTLSGVLFENCTVDASIFVSKCLRAYGGCLGTRSR